MIKLQRLSKAILAIESALTTSIGALWNASTEVTEYYKYANSFVGGKDSSQLPPITPTYHIIQIYPYQTLTIILGAIAVALGLGFILYKWKTRPMPQDHLQGFKKW